MAWPDLSAALRASEERLRSIANNFPGVVFQFYARPTGEFGLYYLSERAEELFDIGPPLEDAYARFAARVAPEHRWLLAGFGGMVGAYLLQGAFSIDTPSLLLLGALGLAAVVALTDPAVLDARADATRPMPGTASVRSSSDLAKTSGPASSVKPVR